jgi:glycerol-3-phosphate acyltransferase PlsX
VHKPNLATAQPVRVAVDAMGGDFAPEEIVKGAIDGAQTYGVSLLLVGLPDAIHRELAKYDTHNLDIHVAPANSVIDMGESPITAIRKKRDASIVVTAKAVGDGQAEAMVAAGSTGAAMASALFNIGRIEGVDRPAIGVVLPSLIKPCLLVDAGANADCIPEMLVQFGQMGTVFMHNVHGVAHPKVGLLNIGEEEGKGNAFVNLAYGLLQKDSQIDFYGNVEGRDLFNGTVDVAVCDGFTGNVALKSAEGVVTMLLKAMKDEFRSTLRYQTGALLLKPALRRMKNLVDPDEFGGALLLGIKGICVISHGGSKANAVKNAIRVAKDAVNNQVLDKMGQTLSLAASTHADPAPNPV